MTARRILNAQSAGTTLFRTQYQLSAAVQVHIVIRGTHDRTVSRRIQLDPLHPDHSLTVGIQNVACRRFRPSCT